MIQINDPRFVTGAMMAAIDALGGFQKAAENPVAFVRLSEYLADAIQKHATGNYTKEEVIRKKAELREQLGLTKMAGYQNVFPMNISAPFQNNMVMDPLAAAAQTILKQAASEETPTEDWVYQEPSEEVYEYSPEELAELLAAYYDLR